MVLPLVCHAERSRGIWRAYVERRGYGGTRDASTTLGMTAPIRVLNCFAETAEAARKILQQVAYLAYAHGARDREALAKLDPDDMAELPRPRLHEPAKRLA